MPVDQEELEGLRNVLTMLWTEMTSLQESAGAIEVLPPISLPPVAHLDWEDIANEDTNADEEVSGAFPGPVPNLPSAPPTQQPTQESFGPPTIENKMLPLPSYNAADVKYRDTEIKARIQQANRTLSALRELIVSKAFQYMDILRQAPRKSVQTRSHKKVYDISQTIMYHTQVYTECQHRLQNLHPNPALFNHFKELQKEDVCTSTAIIEPNSVGSTRIKLSWIWYSKTRCLDPFLQSNSLVANGIDQDSNSDLEEGNERNPD